MYCYNNSAIFQKFTREVIEKRKCVFRNIYEITNERCGPV